MKTTSETRIKVLTLANRLAKANGGDKLAAFIQAWQLVRTAGLEIPCKGVMQGKRQEALKRLARYEPSQIKAVFVPEPENKADPHAIKICVGVQGGKGIFCIGYVPRNLTAIVTAMSAQLPAVRVVSCTWGYASRTTYGARIQLAV